MSALASLPINDAKKSAHLLTQIHFFYTWFTVLSWRDGDEMMVDRFDAQFSHILTLAEQYVNVQGKDSPAGGMETQPQSFPLSRQAFTVGTDVVPCIAMIAFKSRSSSIRKRAIKLLKNINLAGVFDGFYLAAFAQMVMNMEENHARELNGLPEDTDLECHQVPGEARFIEIELSPTRVEEGENLFYKMATGRLVYARYTDSKTRELDVGEAMFSVERPPDVMGATDEPQNACCSGNNETASTRSVSKLSPNGLSTSSTGDMEAPRGWQMRGTGRSECLETPTILRRL